MTIRRLPEGLVNRIAAGEVVERPASAVKELVENAIDSGATRIEVVMREGGRTLVSVTDDGRGMTRDELPLAIARHATSKLPGEDLMNIASLGFRGEALPSIGAVSRMTITSRTSDAESAWRIGLEGGDKGAVEPAAHACGTRVEVRDLFYATPARLKFLKSPRTELGHAIVVVNRLAMANPEIGFSLRDGTREVLNHGPPVADLIAGDAAAARLVRLAQVMGRDFADNALAIEATRDRVRLSGHAGLPTLNRGGAQHQFLFVNARPVRDRLLTGAVRAAYQDFLARDRHSMAALYLELCNDLVDVNVHPAKAEVRFREPGVIRGLIVGALRHALAEAGHRASTTVAGAALGAARPEGARSRAPFPQAAHAQRGRVATGLAESAAAFQEPVGAPTGLPGLAAALGAREVAVDAAPDDFEHYSLGAARGQLHETYIIAQTAEGIVLVDQHAAHERLVYERMKAALAAGGPKRQGLLIPEVVEMNEAAVDRLIRVSDQLAELGLGIEVFGPGAVVVREVPALLGQADVAGLVRDLADEIAEWGEAISLRTRLEDV